MLPQKLRKAARDLGMKYKYGLCYGRVDGYVVSLAPAAGKPELFIDARAATLNAEKAAALRAGLTALGDTYGAKDVSLAKTGVSVLLSHDKAHCADFTEFLYQLINQLKIAGVAGADRCSNCGKEIAAGCIVKAGAHAHACGGECVDKIVGVKRKIKDKTKKRVFSGFWGALFGGVVGLAPWMWLNYAGYYALPALFLVPLAASLGYRIFGGRPCAAKAAVVSLLSLLLYAAGGFLMLCYSVYADWWNSGYTFSRAEVVDAALAALKAPSEAMLAFFKTNVAVGAIFLLIGLVFVVPGALKSGAPYTAVLEKE